MANEPLVLQQQDARGVVTLTLNRPQAFNALSEGMLEALQAALDAVARDAAARVVVIAAGGKAFCAGHDLKEMRAAPSLASSCLSSCGPRSEASWRRSGLRSGAGRRGKGGRCSRRGAPRGPWGWTSRRLTQWKPLLGCR